ncbi:MAG: cyclic pyranopterin monophosphate synthase MoaC [Candidatus Sumerlaeaceae bacterium]
MTDRLTHLDAQGAAQMVDLGQKQPSLREATAEGVLVLTPKVWEAVCEGKFPKGELWNTARVAGILAAKRTHELIPLCHALQLRSVNVNFALDSTRKQIVARARVAALEVTGVEMEALVATSAALLTLYDMLKAVDKGMQIGPIRLLSKSGGKSGTYVAPSESWFSSADFSIQGESEAKACAE